ncbi:MAG: aryl-alcohol dehydrogenase [Deltaproteobacteria bacterium]|nr:aryl-alcohol dehydrogenase [Deltaproteobacteria bacterium]
MKLGLGTVQFGNGYGISNQNGKTPLSEVESILQFANENEISVIDTASLYGDSESVLGMMLPQQHNFRIITKTPFFKKSRISSFDANNLKETFYKSLNRLRQSKVAGLLIHNADDLLTEGGELLFSALQELKQEGFIGKIGVTVYTREQIDGLLESYIIDLMQVPINVLDQNLINNGQLVRLKKKNIEIHARSVFLQGLLLMNPASIHSFFDPIKPILCKYQNFLISHSLTPVECALAFVKGISEIDFVIIGVNNLEQLKINLSSFNKKYDNYILDEFKAFSINNPEFLNPSLWRLK